MSLSSMPSVIVSPDSLNLWGGITDLVQQTGDERFANSLQGVVEGGVLSLTAPFIPNGPLGDRIFRIRLFLDRLDKKYGMGAVSIIPVALDEHHHAVPFSENKDVTERTTIRIVAPTLDHFSTQIIASSSPPEDDRFQVTSFSPQFFASRALRNLPKEDWAVGSRDPGATLSIASDQQLLRVVPVFRTSSLSELRKVGITFQYIPMGTGPLNPKGVVYLFRHSTPIPSSAEVVATQGAIKT